MRVGYFAMPVHPLHRNYTETLKEDRAAVILCDELGFHDAFIGEHLTDKAESITNSMIFQASLIHSTKQIKLGTGTTNLSHIHPVLVATHAAMLDHLAEGRFILGISAGALRSDAEALDILDEDRNQLFAEAIDVILEIWNREPPYDIDLPGNRFKVTTATSMFEEVGVGIMPKPYQQPRPEIVGTVVAPFSKGVVSMGERDFHPLSAHFLYDKWLNSHWDNYAQGKQQAGVTPDRDEWRVARAIFVCDDDATAKRYGREDPSSPYRFYYSQIYKKLKRSKRHAVFKRERDEPDEAINLERILDDFVICGTVDEVADRILALHEATGGFGEIVYAGIDWADETLARRSMQLMAEQVMPRVNDAIGQVRAAQ
jgi:alkanesulfonate monooxygenase SsuD/methylene tetrahydromethanopterin reductase-like flavin-dependent oxidoreductase (luciferase family)